MFFRGNRFIYLFFKLYLQTYKTNGIDDVSRKTIITLPPNKIIEMPINNSINLTISKLLLNILTSEVDRYFHINLLAKY